MQHRFYGFGGVLWGQPLFLNMNFQTVARSNGGRTEYYLTRCPLHRFFHIEFHKF
jgi:hypothetical protein